jgi:hypothetical protein
MQININTSGKAVNHEYKWLNGKPDEWWRALVEKGWLRSAYADVPGFAALCKAGEWMMYFAGIPSNRKDYRSRTIYFQISLRGNVAGPERDRQDALACVQLWLDDLGNGRWVEKTGVLRIADSRFGDILNQQLSEEVVNEYFGDGTSPLGDDLILKLYDEIITDRSAASSSMLGKAVVGAIDDTEDRGAILSTISQMCYTGAEGIVVYCNLVQPKPPYPEIHRVVVRGILLNPATQCRPETSMSQSMTAPEIRGPLERRATFRGSHQEFGDSATPQADPKLRGKDAEVPGRAERVGMGAMTLIAAAAGAGAGAFAGARAGAKAAARTYRKFHSSRR